MKGPHHYKVTAVGSCVKWPLVVLTLHMLTQNIINVWGGRAGKAGRNRSQEGRKAGRQAGRNRSSRVWEAKPDRYRTGAAGGVGGWGGWRWRWPRRSGRWKPLGMSPNLTTFSPTMSASAKMRFFLPSLMHPTGSAFFLAPTSNLVKSQVRPSAPHFQPIAVCYVRMLGALGAFTTHSFIMESHNSKCFSSWIEKLGVDSAIDIQIGSGVDVLCLSGILDLSHTRH